jgi:methylated-DNA-[protein]-cysteine S-methyltransferase
MIDDSEGAWTRIPSPVGDLIARVARGALTRLDFARGDDAPRGPAAEGDPLLERVAAQIDEYFAGRRRAFDLPLAPRGTPFQRRVWDSLLEIPYGATQSYGAIARRIGQPTAVRAVGLANGRNPIAIIIPCHRVIGTDGSLTGYAGGLAIKRALLALESGGSPISGQRALELA